MRKNALLAVLCDLYGLIQGALMAIGGGHLEGCCLVVSAIGAVFIHACSPGFNSTHLMALSGLTVHLLEDTNFARQIVPFGAGKLTSLLAVKPGTCWWNLHEEQKDVISHSGMLWT